MKKKKAIAAGHICLDITPVFSNTVSSDNFENILSPGKMIQMDEADVHTGGSVANTGLAMKKLGIDTSLMGKIGNDHFGNIVLNILKEYDADKNMIISNDYTSYSIVISPPGIDRMFLHNPGANNTFSSIDLDFEKIAQADHFHFGYPCLMSKLYENDGQEIIDIFKKVKESNVMTSLDMAAVDPNTEAGKVNWKTILKKLLPYVDFFVPSLEEIMFMLNRKKYDEFSMKKDFTDGLSITNDIEPLAQQLIRMGTAVVLIKCGTPGIYFQTGSKEHFKKLEKQTGISFKNWPEQKGFEKSYTVSEVLSATGAGDTSIAGFLSAMLNGNTLKECLQFATATGACCVQGYDALSGLIPFDEMKDKIEAGWGKIEISLRP